MRWRGSLPDMARSPASGGADLRSAERLERTLLLNDELFATNPAERSENVIASSLGAEAERVIQALNGGTDPFDNLEDRCEPSGQQRLINLEEYVTVRAIA